MENLFTIDNLFTLAMLILLQAVLGFDNLLYISIESKRVPEDRKSYVRKMGIGLAVGLRIVLLFLLMSAIQYFQEPFFSIDLKGILEGTVNVHALIVLIGGVFIMYTAIKEIMHMLSVEDIEKSEGTSKRTVGSALFWIILMNLIFSFDSILTALALSDTFLVIATSIIVTGLMMIFLADHVAEFLKKNRMYEVLGLFILFIVGILLLSEGGHLAHLKLFGYAVEPMAKSTFYFVLAVMVAVDIVQSRYRAKLMAQRQEELGRAAG